MVFNNHIWNHGNDLTSGASSTRLCPSMKILCCLFAVAVLLFDLAIFIPEVLLFPFPVIRSAQSNQYSDSPSYLQVISSWLQTQCYIFKFKS